MSTLNLGVGSVWGENDVVESTAWFCSNEEDTSTMFMSTHRLQLARRYLTSRRAGGARPDSDTLDCGLVGTRQWWTMRSSQEQ